MIGALRKALKWTRKALRLKGQQIHPEPEKTAQVKPWAVPMHPNCRCAIPTPPPRFEIKPFDVLGHWEIEIVRPTRGVVALKRVLTAKGRKARRLDYTKNKSQSRKWTYRGRRK